MILKFWQIFYISLKTNCIKNFTKAFNKVSTLTYNTASRTVMILHKTQLKSTNQPVTNTRVIYICTTIHDCFFESLYDEAFLTCGASKSSRNFSCFTDKIVYAYMLTTMAPIIPPVILFLFLNIFVSLARVRFIFSTFFTKCWSLAFSLLNSFDISTNGIDFPCLSAIFK